MTRPITFPKTADGVYTNHETGVRVERYGKGWRAFRPTFEGGWIGICVEQQYKTNAQHLAMRYIRDSIRHYMGEDHAEALTMNADRDQLAHAMQTATRYIETQTPQRGRGLAQVGNVAQWTDVERAGIIHHVTRYGNVVSCGIVGRVRAEYTAMKVTCEACKTADYQHLVDNAHAEALDDEIERAEAEAYREHYYRLMDEIVAAGKIFPPAARDMAGTGRYDDACRFIYSWQGRDIGTTIHDQIEAVITAERHAPLCLRMTGAHIQHMTADPDDPTCRDTADLHPVEAVRDLAAERQRGDLRDMWSDVDWYEQAR